MNKFVKFSAACGVAVLGFAMRTATGAEPPIEATAVSHMESTTADPYRDPGVFGEYWWANRFLSRQARRQDRRIGSGGREQVATPKRRTKRRQLPERNNAKYTHEIWSIAQLDARRLGLLYYGL